MMTQMRNYRSILGLALMAMLLFMPGIGHAEGGPAPIVIPEVCTSFTERALEMEGSIPVTGGILSSIYNLVTEVVDDATQRLFTAFTADEGYQNAVYWAIVLMVTFYGIGFTIGIVQPSFQQVLVRLFKMGIIFALISPTGWEFFSDTVVRFFQDGTDDLIIGVQNIATHVPMPEGATPFYVLDRVAEFLIQPDTIIAILGSVGAGGPYGLTMGALMAIAFLGFFRMLLVALSTYAITFVARALVLGVAPIFFIFLLFDRTKGLFISWLNALINLSLQPILLFTFLSFFIVMIESAAQNMMGSELCWGEFSNISGSTSKLSFWRFKNPETGAIETGDYTYKGSLECLISDQAAGTAKCPPFPINPVNLLSFLILVYLAQRFVDVVKRISSELSNAFVGLDSSGKLEQIMNSQKGGGFGFTSHKGVNKP